ncbi:hypothetical protein EVAR_7980_1 [Eumeta japonica]|uniref:Uncharacterized protein n=1 Tax=Eumeta variegata TaxID=151549 RepID=A0A4C1TJY2_EUMVA|nr:hypothetical protein EVAR_7980_1 [Eumeta japonica]
MDDPDLRWAGPARYGRGECAARRRDRYQCRSRSRSSGGWELVTVAEIMIDYIFVVFSHGRGGARPARAAAGSNARRQLCHSYTNKSGINQLDCDF